MESAPTPGARSQPGVRSVADVAVGWNRQLGRPDPDEHTRVVRPIPSDLVDSFGRVVRDLRISVTDRCNFRCVYCMPAEGMRWLPRDEVLSFEEIGRIARLFVERFGVTGIRLTGGEPTVRADLPRLVAMLAALGVDMAMTTNGTRLRLLADGLRGAG